MYIRGRRGCQAGGHDLGPAEEKTTASGGPSSIPCPSPFFCWNERLSEKIENREGVKNGVRAELRLLPIMRSQSDLETRKRSSARTVPGLAGKGTRDQLLRIYELLYAQFGGQHWWPGEDPFEVIVGAILAQNTSWKNVEKAIAHLKEAGDLFPEGIATVSLEQLADLIRPSGTYRLKADRLLRFVAFLDSRYGFSLEAMFRVPLRRIRAELLAVKGIGPETADSILLYAGGYPVFVVDAYTKRIFSRHGFVQRGCAYGELQALFMEALPPDVSLFNEYHALIVRLGKSRCRALPICEDCALQSLL